MPIIAECAVASYTENNVWVLSIDIPDNPGTTFPMRYATFSRIQIQK
jgi:hypothetical protein